MKAFHGPLLHGVCPAKLNLALAITRRRSDGYHTLRSVFVRLELHDELEAWATVGSGEADGLEVGGLPGAPVEGNLVLQAAVALRTAVALRSAGGRPLPGLRFRLTKRIPTAAGLGGGSSDAATALRLASSLWDLSLPLSEQLELALGLGSDVPFFMVRHGAALVSGIGQELRPLPTPMPAAGILAVTPVERLPTATVFAESDRIDPGRSSRQGLVDDLVAALTAGLSGSGLADLAPRLRDANDLWPAAVRLSARLGPQREALETVLGRAVLLTGSGTTLFAIYPSDREAIEAAADLAHRNLPSLAGATIAATTTATASDSADVQGGPT